MTARGIVRVTGHHLETVLKVLNESGRHCRTVLDERMRNLEVDEIQADETWTYCVCKDARIRADHPSEAGSYFLFIALDPCSKAVVAFRLGRRNNRITDEFIKDLASRIDGRFHLSTDAWGAYPHPVHRHLNGRVDYGQLIKSYGQPDDPDARHRYTPPKVVSVQWRSVAGYPRHDTLCTSHVERFNASLRTYSKRFCRLTLAFSRKLENLENAICLAIADYNFVKINRGVGMTPTMAIGATSTPWTADRLIP